MTLTLVGPVPPPMGGISIHVLDVRRMLEHRGMRVRIMVPRRSPALLGEFARAASTGIVHAHIHGHSRSAWLQAAAFGAAPRAALTVHSGLAPRFIVHNRALVRAACKGYAAVVAVSEVLRDALVAADVEPERLWVAPAFLSEALDNRWPPAGLSAIRRRHPVLLCAAVAPGAEYGTEVLLDGFTGFREIHPEAALVLYGPESHRKELARPGVYLLGELERAEVLGVLASCDLFVRPTLADGDAISVREALALGRRVVASDAARRPPGAHLHRAGDSDDLCRALDAALAERPRRVAVTEARQTLLTIYRRLGARLEEPCVASPAA